MSAQDQELKMVKVMMKSLVMSSPTAMDARALSRDYGKENGENIPYWKYGYRELVPFLRERCDDCFVYSGNPANPIVTPIINERTRHINDLVSKQRISSNAKCKVKRRSVLESQVRPCAATNRRALDINTVPAPQTVKSPLAHAHGSVRPILSQNSSQAVRNHSENIKTDYRRMAEATIVPVSPTMRKPLAHVYDGGSASPMGIRNSSRNIDNHSGSAETTYTRAAEVIMKPALQTVGKSLASQDSTVETHLAKIPTVRGGTLKAVEKYLLQNREGNASVREGNFKSDETQHIPSLFEKQYDKPTLSHFPQFVEKKSLQRINEKEAFRGATPKNTSRSVEKEPSPHPVSSEHSKMEDRCTPEPSPAKNLSGHSGYNALYFNSIRAQLEELLDSYPDGVWLEELEEVYSDMFGCELDYKRLGYESVESLCRGTGDVVRLMTVSGAEGLQLVVGAGQPASKRSHPPPPPRLRPASRLLLHAADEESGDSDDAVGGMPYDDGIFPSDCMDRLQSIPQLPASRLVPGAVVEVLVSEVLDPSHFWFQLRSDEHDLALNALMDEMTQYYARGAGRERVMEYGAVQVGQYCATNFDVDGWHRSVIVQLVGPHSVKVRHVDYGSVTTATRKELRYLRKQWSSLPAQAVRGCLAQLRPAGGASCWMHSAAVRFLELIRDRPLVAEIHSVDTQAQVVRMFLADTTSEQDVYINRKLVEENRASCFDFDKEILEDFLLPSFDDLEMGEAMNFADKCELVNSGIFPEGVERPFSLPVVVRRDTVPQPSPPRAAPERPSVPTPQASGASSLHPQPPSNLSTALSQINLETTMKPESQISRTTAEMNNFPKMYERTWEGWRSSCAALPRMELQSQHQQTFNVPTSQQLFVGEQRRVVNASVQAPLAPLQIPKQSSVHRGQESDGYSWSQNLNTNSQQSPSQFTSQLHLASKSDGLQVPHHPMVGNVTKSMQYPNSTNPLWQHPQYTSPQLQIPGQHPKEAITQHIQTPNLENLNWQPPQLYSMSHQYSDMRLPHPPNVGDEYPSPSNHPQYSGAQFLSAPSPNMLQPPQATNQWRVAPHADLNSQLHPQPDMLHYSESLTHPTQHTPPQWSSQRPQDLGVYYGPPSDDTAWNLPPGTEALSHLNNLQRALPGLEDQYRAMRMSVASAPPHLAQATSRALNAP